MRAQHLLPQLFDRRQGNTAFELTLWVKFYACISGNGYPQQGDRVGEFQLRTRDREMCSSQFCFCARKFQPAHFAHMELHLDAAMQVFYQLQVLARMIDFFLATQHAVKGVFGISDHRKPDRLSGGAAAIDHRVRRSLPGAALRGDLDRLVSGIVLEQAGESRNCDWTRILLPFIHLQAGIAVCTRNACRRHGVLGACRGFLQSRAIAPGHRHGFSQR